MEKITFKRYTDSQGIYAEVFHKGVNVGHASLTNDSLDSNNYLSGFLNTYSDNDKIKIQCNLIEFLKSTTI